MATNPACTTCRHYIESEERLWDTDVPVEWDCTKPGAVLGESHNPDTDRCENWEVRGLRK